MALLNVVKFGHPVLRQTARPYEHISDIDQKFIDDMIETMKIEDGIGLAANQVGVAKQLAIVSDTKDLYVVINPVITGKSVKYETEVEGCLSLPGLQGQVKRHYKVIVKSLDRYGKPQEITASGLLARVFQHEIDHLHGVLYIDRAEQDTLNWVHYEVDHRGKEITELKPTQIDEIQQVFRATYNHNISELKFDRIELGLAEYA